MDFNNMTVTTCLYFDEEGELVCTHMHLNPWVRLTAETIETICKTIEINGTCNGDIWIGDFLDMHFDFTGDQRDVIKTLCKDYTSMFDKYTFTFEDHTYKDETKESASGVGPPMSI